jgi:hypothetical protein
MLYIHNSNLLLCNSIFRLTSNSWKNSFAEQEYTNALENDLLQDMMALGMDDKSHLQHDYPVKSRIILEDTDDVSLLHDPRLSLENHTNSQDLMAHMHGMTPVPRKGRPPRLSLQSIGSVSTTGTASKYPAASPFPQPPVSSIGQNSHTKYDFVETYVFYCISFCHQRAIRNSYQLSFLQTNDETARPGMGFLSGQRQKLGRLRILPSFGHRRTFPKVRAESNRRR